jgi:hypothetical protein
MATESICPDDVTIQTNPNEAVRARVRWQLCLPELTTISTKASQIFETKFFACRPFEENDST